MEATVFLLFVVIIMLEISLIPGVLAAIVLSHAWLFWFAFGPVRCSACGTWQRRRSPV